MLLLASRWFVPVSSSGNVMSFLSLIAECNKDALLYLVNDKDLSLIRSLCEIA